MLQGDGQWKQCISIEASKRCLQGWQREREHINGYGSDGEKQSSIFPSDCTGGFFADQFDNMANFRAHYEGTGPEIWEQTGGHLDAFIAAAGTVAGVSRFIVKNDRLFLGSSSAMNCVGAVREAQWLGPGHTIVTILCDSGMRHISFMTPNICLSSVEHPLQRD